jgi:hypothetical protein
LCLQVFRIVGTPIDACHMHCLTLTQQDVEENFRRNGVHALAWADISDIDFLRRVQVEIVTGVDEQGNVTFCCSATSDDVTLSMQNGIRLFTINPQNDIRTVFVDLPGYIMQGLLRDFEAYPENSIVGYSSDLELPRLHLFRYPEPLPPVAAPLQVVEDAIEVH